jgi:RNA polymerase sigma-70 factor, ECF subfamily
MQTDHAPAAGWLPPPGAKGAQMTVDRHEAPEDAEATGLMQRVARGDREAFAALFRQIAPRLKGYFYRLGCRDDLAEELTQDVMVTVWRKADQFDRARGNVFSWIFVIARNRRIDSSRRERATTLYGAAPPDAVDDTLTPGDELAILHQRKAQLEKALNELPKEQSEVIVRAYFWEQPHPEIAAALGLALGTVKSRIRLGAEKLKLILEDKT